MNMGVEIKRVVQDLGRVSIEQVLHEAIMNSIHANADSINISINYKSMGEKFPCHVTGMTIVDNGEGFTQKNTNSFELYKSTHKQEMGAKGVGRFLFLKLFENVFITSIDKEITFNINDVLVKEVTDNSAETTIKFSGVNKNIDLNLKSIENNIKEHFLPYFHLRKNEPAIKITLIANDAKIFTINSKDIPTFKVHPFTLQNYTFKINYVLNHYKTPKNNGFYCADNRVVIKNNKDDKIKLKSFRDVNILFLLSSGYLDKKVIDTRDDFAIYPKQKQSMYDELSWNDIQEKLSENLKKILLSNGIDTDENAKRELDAAKEKAPYLSKYLSKNPYGVDSDKLIDDAERLLEKDKEILRENKYKNQKEYNKKLHLVTESELAEYIFDRQKIIDNLKKITNENSLEKEIHNLFMQKNTADENLDYKSNNLWLLDDRFMIYNKVFSDKQVKDIFPELSDNIKRPDILSIVSNTYNKKDITDIVIIEVKRPDNKITPSGAEEQLLEYARYVNSANSNNKIRIWTYAFLKFDDDTISKLNDKSYNKIPTHSKYSIYYQYYKSRNVIINFMDYGALADDANTRNKTFMNILSNKV